MSEMEYILEVKDIKKHFPLRGGFFSRIIGYVYAVDGVSFKLPTGATLGLVGESGCGKSTLGRTILRLYNPTSGNIIFRGRDITQLPPAELRPLRRQFQIIFQDPYSSLNPRMTIRSILNEPYIIHKLGTPGERNKKVASLLETVGLGEEALDRYPHEFSGGQRQRIGIARALTLEPSLIIADEPVSALDVSIQSQILNLMDDLQKKFKLSYLFIAHDLAVIEHISDFVAVMYLGRIVEYAEAETLYEKPLHPYTQALIEAIPVPKYDPKKRKGGKKVISGDVPSPISPPSGCHFHPRCPLAEDRCRKEVPLLREMGDGKNSHLVACHLA